MLWMLMRIKVKLVVCLVETKEKNAHALLLSRSLMALSAR